MLIENLIHTFYPILDLKFSLVHCWVASCQDRENLSRAEALSLEGIRVKIRVTPLLPANSAPSIAITAPGDCLQRLVPQVSSPTVARQQPLFT